MDSLTVTPQEQNQPIPPAPEIAPVIAPVSESKEIQNESKRGGKRKGAGRPPNLSKRLLKGFSREAIAEAIADMDCGAVLKGLLKSKREKTRLEALAFIRDTLIGRPAQNVQLSGGVMHAQRNLETLGVPDG